MSSVADERDDEVVEQPVCGLRSRQLRPVAKQLRDAVDAVVDAHAAPLDEPVRVGEHGAVRRQGEARLPDLLRRGPPERRRVRLIEARDGVGLDVEEQ